jgi:Na+(H+)/acetate symporter ActP
MGLLLNGIIKVPMQFFILLIGAMVFVFNQFVTPPLYFNPVQHDAVKSGAYASEYMELERKHERISEESQQIINDLINGISQNNDQQIRQNKQSLQEKHQAIKDIRNQAVRVIKKQNPGSDGNDTNYIFLSFVLNFLPAGLIGLVLAAILSASMSSTSAELNALASTSVIDIYRRMVKKEGSEHHYLLASKFATIFWGIIAISFALFANRLGTLIEAVNILGSLFYGTILGIFLVAFYIKRIGGTAVFYSAILAEIIVLSLFLFTDIPYLWFNFIGCILVVIMAALFQLINKSEKFAS